MKKLNYLNLFMAALIAFSFASCGDDDSDDGGSTPAPTLEGTWIQTARAIESNGTFSLLPDVGGIFATLDSNNTYMFDADSVVVTIGLPIDTVKYSYDYNSSMKMIYLENAAGKDTVEVYSLTNTEFTQVDFTSTGQVNGQTVTSKNLSVFTKQ